jgi:PAS domain S-box-containing protein
MTHAPLRLLLVEDSDDDALLVSTALERHGYAVECVRVMTEDGFREALGGGVHEIILCDYRMPSFDAFEALEILRESDRDIPLIIVSGTISETDAVRAMRLGAADYLLKDNLIRLGAAVERELRDAGIRRQKRLADAFSRSQNEVLEKILIGVPLRRVLQRIALCAANLSGGGACCAIMLTVPECDHLVLGAESGFGEEFFDALGTFAIGEGMSSCGAAAALGETVIFTDIAKLSKWKPFMDACRGAGLRACWSVPVFSSDRSILATLGLYLQEARAPSPEEIRWVESASKLASLAIERSRAAERLRESEALLRIASEATHIGGWIVEYPGMRVTWSDQVCAIHEVPPGTNPGFDGMRNFCAPEFHAKMDLAYDGCFSEGTPIDMEVQIITAGGRRIWVRTIGEAVRDETGAVCRIQGAFKDITERKSADEVLRANELRYLTQRNALIALTRETQPEILRIEDALLRITETTARTLGVERVSVWRFTDERGGIECLDLYESARNRHSAGATLIASDYPTYFKCIESMELLAADDAINNPGTREFSENYLKPLGIGSMMDVPVRLGDRVDHLLCCEHVGPVRHWTPDEKTFAVAVANLISLSLEIRDRTLARQEVLLSQQRFQSVASATNDTIWDWNLETDDHWWYDGTSKLFGSSASEKCGFSMDWIQRIHPDDRERVVSGIYQAIGRGDAHWSDEYRFISDDGKVAHVLDRGQVIRDSTGKGVRMVGGMMDLTEKKAAERELARSHRALRMLSSCNEMLLRAPDETALLEEACRIAVEVGGYRAAWVGYVMEDDPQRIVPRVRAGEMPGDLPHISPFQAVEMADGGAVSAAQPVAIADVPHAADIPGFAEHARKCGHPGAVNLPLVAEGRLIGALCLLGADSQPVGADEIQVLREMANDLSFGIANMRSREMRQRTEAVIIKVAQTVSGGSGSEFFDLLAGNMVEALGARVGLIGKVDFTNRSIDTISYVLNGKLMENISYDLAGTPCENVAGGAICVLERGVRRMFPDNHVLSRLGIEAYVGIPLLTQNGVVEGVMAVFFTSPLHETALVTSTLRIFAARAASELGRQQADARIREQASLLDKARDAILVRDLNHRITYWNKSAVRLYGWTAEEAVGRSVVDLLYLDKSGFHEAHEQTLLNGEWIGELTQIDMSGRELVIEGRWSLVSDDAGRPQSVLAINTDITEYRRLERQFIRAQRLESIGILAGGIAHDLNNILTPISMAVELLKMREPEARSLELLDTISSSAKRGANMVGRVLSFARGVEGRHVRLHPRRIIAEIESILRDTFPRNIELEVNADRDLWIIDGDPTQIHQVLLNLCVNAGDAISGAGRISINAQNVHLDASFAAANLEAAEGPYVCIRVRDSGEGIPPDIIDRIFDPFFTTKPLGKGTGLGLSTSLAIVRSHGGFIRISSKPGAGTLARVYLPAHPEFEEVPGSLSQVDPPNGGGETVLVVDDEAAIREIACHALENFGYRTLVAANGEEGLAVYTEHRLGIDIVFTDLMMPVMDGREMIRRILEINPGAKIVATSGIGPNPDSPHSFMECVMRFLPKPYTADALLNCIRQTLGNDGPPA